MAITLSWIMARNLSTNYSVERKQCKLIRVVTKVSVYFETVLNARKFTPSIISTEWSKPKRNGNFSNLIREL